MLTMPEPIPVTTPPALTVATVGVPLVHEPPAGQPESVIVFPEHTLDGPLTTSAGLTVNGVVTNAEPTL